MNARFAPLEQMVDASVLDHLANAIAVVDGEDVPVIFDRPYAGAFGGQVDTSSPTCVGPMEKLGGLERDARIAIGGAGFLVLTAEQEGATLVRLILAEA